MKSRKNAADLSSPPRIYLTCWLFHFLCRYVFIVCLLRIYPELFVAILGYASVGTYVTTQLGGKLVGLNFDQLQTEADFR